MDTVLYVKSQCEFMLRYVCSLQPPEEKSVSEYRVKCTATEKASYISTAVQ